LHNGLQLIAPKNKAKYKTKIIITTYVLKIITFTYVQNNSNSPYNNYGGL
jgi:hypothetical protein